jgi:hypothetical protein
MSTEEGFIQGWRVFIEGNRTHDSEIKLPGMMAKPTIHKMN